MKCGIIMQITETELIVLTPEGEFINLVKERNDYQLGEEIRIDIAGSKSVLSKKNGWKIKPLVSTLAAALLLVVSFIPALFTNSKVSAYVSMDVKSSIEIGVTDDLKVVEVKGINEEGKKIISKLKEWKGREMDDVIGEMVALNQSAGHIQSNPNILFSTVVIEKDDHHFEKSLQRKLKDIQEIPQIEDAVKVEMKKASIKDREEASDKGVSTGTYLEQTNKKSKSHTSNRVLKNDKRKVTEKAGNQARLGDDVKTKSQPGNDKKTTPIQHTQVNQPNVIKSVKNPVSVPKDVQTKKNIKPNTVKREGHKRQSSNHHDTYKQNERKTIQKNQKPNSTSNESNRNKKSVDKSKNQQVKHEPRPKPNKKPNENRKNERTDKHNKHNQYQKHEKRNAHR